MSYKLKKTDLIKIAEYVIQMKETNEDQLISSFYQKLMFALDSNKDQCPDNYDNNDFDNVNYIEINSDDDEMFHSKTESKNKKNKKNIKNTKNHKKNKL